MTESVANLRNKKDRRVVIGSVSVLALLAAGGLALSVYERLQDVYDRVH